eukprot:2325791-Pleurochrysis_carterae.AAC.1
MARAKWVRSVGRAKIAVTRGGPYRPDARGGIRNQRRGRLVEVTPCAQRGCWLAVVRVGVRASRTGGGPPSGTLALKKRLTENVEQGGDAMIAA